MRKPNEARRVQTDLRKLCRELNLRYYKGGIGICTDVVGSGERIPDLIGYFCTRGLTLHPGVLPHLANLILELVDWYPPQPEFRTLIEQFLLTHRDHCMAYRGRIHCGVVDFLNAENPGAVARKELSRRLDLEFPRIDWAIVNADPKRVTEWLALWADHREEMAPHEAMNLATLVMRTLDASLAVSRLRAEDWPVAQQLMMWLKKAQYTTPESPDPLWFDSSRLRDSSLRDFFEGCWDGNLGPEVRKEISRNLGLESPAAGWAMHNGSAGRALEFAAVYQEGWSRGRTLFWLREVGDLMLAAIEDLCRLREMTGEEKLAVAQA
jgi:hypothetical protein